MSNAYQVAFFIQTLLTMPGAGGKVVLQVPGMTMKNMRDAYKAIGSVLAINYPEAQMQGNVVTAPTSNMTVYLRLPEFDVYESKVSAEDSGALVDTFAGTDEMSAPTSR